VEKGQHDASLVEQTFVAGQPHVSVAADPVELARARPWLEHSPICVLHCLSQQSPMASERAFEKPEFSFRILHMLSDLPAVETRVSRSLCRKYLARMSDPRPGAGTSPNRQSSRRISMHEMLERRRTPEHGHKSHQGEIGLSATLIFFAAAISSKDTLDRPYCTRPAACLQQMVAQDVTDCQ
jgi:hypothetical protein